MEIAVFHYTGLTLTLKQSPTGIVKVPIVPN